MGLKSGGRQDGSVAGNASRMAAEYGYNSGDILSGSGCLRILVSPEKTKVDYVLCDGDESDATVAFSDGVPPGLGDASNDAMRETTP